MSTVKDGQELGYWPLQDHRADADPALRNVPRGVRIVGRDMFGRYTVAGYHEDEGPVKVLGDLQGAGWLPVEPSGPRLCGSFVFATPVVVVDDDPKPQAGDTADDTAGLTGTRVRGAPPAEQLPAPLRVRVLRDAGTPDERYREIVVQDAPRNAGVLVFGTEERAQAPVFIPAGSPLVADHETGGLSREVYGVRDERIVRSEPAPLHGFLKVVPRPATGEPEALLAWHWRGSGALAEGGLLSQAGHLAALDGVVRVGVEGPDAAHHLPHMGTSPTPTLAHLRPSAPWYQGPNLDGPIEFGKPPYGATPGSGSARRPASLLFDPHTQRWRTEYTASEDYAEPDPPPDVKIGRAGESRVRTGDGWTGPGTPDPWGRGPSTWRARGGGGGGGGPFDERDGERFRRRGGGGAGGGGGGPRGGDGPGPGPGVVAFDKLGNPLSRQGGRARGGTGKLDKFGVPSPYGVGSALGGVDKREAAAPDNPNQPKRTGEKINKARLRALIAAQDPPRQRGARKGAFAKAAGVNVDDVTPAPGAYEVADLLGERVLDHTGAVTSPGVRPRAGDSPGTAAFKSRGKDRRPRFLGEAVLASGLAFAGEETQKAAPTAARGGPLSAADRRHVTKGATPVVRLKGMLASDDGSFKGAGRPGRAGTQGALVPLPPDLTLAEYLAGRTSPGGLEARIVMPSGESALFFAQADEITGGGVRGVMVTSTSTGVLFQNVDSEGEIVPGGSMLYGEGGLAVTGNLDVSGKATIDGMVDPPGIKVSEGASVPGGVTAGYGTFWVRNDAPNVPMFTDDAGADHQLAGSGASTVPTGAVMPFARTAAPTGWLACDGSAVSRTTYAALYAVQGDAFGPGNGTTTFNLPDLRGRVPAGTGTGTGGGAEDNNGGSAPTGGSALTARSLGEWTGAETHALTSAEGPSHTHGIDAHYVAGGAGNFDDLVKQSGPAGVSLEADVDTKASGSNTAHNNVQPIMCLLFCVKT